MDGEALTAETYRADRGLQQIGAHWDGVGPAANRPVAVQFVDFLVIRTNTVLIDMFDTRTSHLLCSCRAHAQGVEWNKTDASGKIIRDRMYCQTF